MNLYVTGFKSFFSSIIRNNLSEFNLYEIKSLTDSNSNNMRFELNLDVLNNQDTYIMHAAWNMKERNIKKSHSINVLGTKLFFDSLSQDQKKRFIFISSTSAFKNTVLYNENLTQELEKKTKKKHFKIVLKIQQQLCRK